MESNYLMPDGPKDLDDDSTFTNTDETVINYKGANYYKACDVLVAQVSTGDSYCVKRVGHPGSVHEDWAGNIKRIGGPIQTTKTGEE